MQLSARHSLLLSSMLLWCLSPHMAASAMPYANPHAPKGGQISFAALGSFDNLNSMNGQGNAAEGVQYLYDSLMKRSLDQPAVAYPLLAQSVTYDPHAPKYAIFHLNPAAKFSDGSAVTAADVAYTFNTLLSQGAPGIQLYFAGIAKVRALNRLDVRFDFHSTGNKELPLLVAGVSIFSQKNLKNQDFRRLTLHAPLGSGPYRLSQVVAGRRIVYQRNLQYWGRALPVNRGAYNFDQIAYVYYRNPEVAFEGFQTGQYTVHHETQPRRWQTGYHCSACQQGLIKKISYQHQLPISGQHLVFNTRRQPLNDLNFRHALSYAYDFEWQNKAMFYQQYRRLQSYFDNSELAAVGLPSAAELRVLKPYLQQLSALERYGVLIDWRYPVSDGSGFNRRNLLIARQILLQSGYRFNAQGQLLDRQQRPIVLELLLSVEQGNLQRALLPLQRNLNKLGISLKIRQVDLPQYIQRSGHYDFDLISNALPQSLTPGNEQAQFWTSAAADQAGNYNYAGIKNPVIDAVVEQLIHAENRQQLILYSKVLDRLLRAGYYQILLYGKASEWYAVWDMYQRPKRLARLNIGVEYWWSDAKKTQRIQQYWSAHQMSRR
jgi:microcin C transport system substrate-binding protein